ncbi:MAG: thioredoxin domain-containing protein [Propioniciclava sp.]|uniref:DsbA family protein n=1 Tax=Propioniciclava sp. TaxID=2038686 RepID=UPI0039E66B3A
MSSLPPPSSTPTLQPRAGRSGRRKALLAALWAISVVVAFLIGTQVPLGAGAPGAVPAPGTPGTSAAPAQTPDPQLQQFLRELPRRQAGDPLALGKVDAPVVLTNWSDYRCPFCAKWHQETLPQLKAAVDAGTLRIEFRDLVLFGDESAAAAVAARAAGQQGKFWEFQEAVFSAAPASGHPEIARDDLIAFARTAGVPDLAAFETALDDETLRAAVEADTAHAREIGISGTPFFVVGSQPINGAQPADVFQQVIAAEAAR